jgi:hypothetical protein
MFVRLNIGPAIPPRRGFRKYLLSNEFPKNDSTAKALRGLRLVPEPGFRTLHGREL